MWENFVSLRYLNVQDGWLSVGLHNVTPETNSSPIPRNREGNPTMILKYCTQWIVSWKPSLLLILCLLTLARFQVNQRPGSRQRTDSCTSVSLFRDGTHARVSGKGSCLPYDAGVLHETYRRFDALRNNRVIVAGNSSGSIPAAFFCCYGFTDNNVQHATERLRLGNRDAVRNMEDVSNKFSKVAQGRSTEIFPY